MIHALENNDLQTGYNLPINWDQPNKKIYPQTTQSNP